MPQYRRSITKGGTYFFTVVTFRRQPILIKPESRFILRQVINNVRQQYPFAIDAWVLFPEHLHCIWTMPADDNDYSKRWGLIKSGFTKNTKSLFHRDDVMNASKRKHRESTVWQRRFWEHEIRNNEDFHRHVNYIHYNPVKHGLVARVKQWPYSTYHQYVKKNVYPANWGGDMISDMNSRDGEFGE